MIHIRAAVVSTLLATSCLIAPLHAQATGDFTNKSGGPRLGFGVTTGICHTPYGLVTQAAVPLATPTPWSIGLVGAIRWSVFGLCPQSQFGPSDQSRIGVLTSVALRAGLAITRRVTAFVQAGEAAGSWTNLPASDAHRPAIVVPFGEAGIGVQLARRVVLEVAALNVRNVLNGDDATGATVLLTLPLRR